MTQTSPETQYVDAATIGIEESRATWAVAARSALEATAHTYQGVITNKELAAAVQETSQVSTTQRSHYWIGDVLARVARECATNDEPSLASLCVDATGAVSGSYATTVFEIHKEPVEDPDMHAARERLACYRHFGADLPEGGGSVMLTPRVRASRQRAAAQAREDRPVVVCLACNTALPASGQCDYCD